MCLFRPHKRSLNAVIGLLAGQFKIKTSFISCFAKKSEKLKLPESSILTFHHWMETALQQL